MSKLRDSTQIVPIDHYQAFAFASFVVPNCYKEALNSIDKEQGMEAVADELQSLAEDGTLKMVF